MTISLTGTGGLFTRLGKIGRVLADGQTFGGTTLATDIANVYAQYTADESLIDGLQGALKSGQTGAESPMFFLQTVAANTVNKAVFSDNPQFSNSSLATSMAEVIRQMRAGSASVLAMTVGCSAAAGGSNTGNGTLVCSSVLPSGLAAEQQFGEVLYARCVADSTTGATAGNERFSILGKVAEPDVFAADWPLGSGGSTAVTAVNPSVDNSNGQLLTNGDFETFTVANVPDGWVIAVGVAGTDILQSTAQHYTGLSSLNLVGDGTTLSTLTQTFNSSSGTLGNPTYQTAYAVNCWIKVDSTPAAGVLEFALVDGSGTVVNDTQGTANLFTKSLTAVSTTWIPVSGVFRTPYIMPGTLKLRVRLSTALTSSHNLFVDRIGFSPMSQLYAGGPSFAMFSGAANWYAPDFFTVTATNGYGSGGTLNTFQLLFERLFSMRAMGLVLPSSGSPTISDSLI